MYWARLNGIVLGYSDTQFAPDDPITREQLAAMLYRYAQFKGYDVTASGDLSGFADGGHRVRLGGGGHELERGRGSHPGG